MDATTDKPLRSMLVIGATLEDARDFIGRDFMGRIDNVAPRKLAIPDEIWPRDETMTAEFCTPDTIPMRAFDIVVLTASLWGPPSSLYSLARARTKTDGVLWRETPPRSLHALTATPGERAQAPDLPSPSDGTPRS